MLNRIRGVVYFMPDRVENGRVSKDEEGGQRQNKNRKRGQTQKGEVDVRRSQKCKKRPRRGKPSGPGVLGHPPADLDFGDLQGLNFGFSVLLEAVSGTDEFCITAAKQVARTTIGNGSSQDYSTDSIQRLLFTESVN